MGCLDSTDDAGLTSLEKPMIAPDPQPGFALSIDRGAFRFLSGAVHRGPVGGRGDSGLAERAEGEFADQAEALVAHLATVMQGAGGIHGLARLHLYQQDKRMFPILEAARIRHEGSDPAPSSGIGVASIRDTRALRWELDGIGMSAAGFARWGLRQKYDDGAAGRSASHYGQAVGIGPYAFLAGMIPIDVESGVVIRGYDDVAADLRFFRSGRSHTDSRRGPIIAQTASLLDRIFRLVGELGSTSADIVSCTVFLSRPLDFGDVIRVFREMFGSTQPSLQIVTVDEVGHKGTVIEIECTVATAGVRNRMMLGSPGGDVIGTVADDLVFVGDQLAVGITGGWQEELRAALVGVDERLSALGCTPDDLAALTVQLVRPLPTEPVAVAVAGYLGGRNVALTVLSVSALGHDPAAAVAVSAIAVPHGS